MTISFWQWRRMIWTSLSMKEHAVIKIHRQHEMEGKNGHGDISHPNCTPRPMWNWHPLWSTMRQGGSNCNHWAEFGVCLSGKSDEFHQGQLGQYRESPLGNYNVKGRDDSYLWTVGKRDDSSRGNTTSEPVHYGKSNRITHCSGLSQEALSQWQSYKYLSP